ncbi:MAG: arsenate reductase (azurin) large subunit [Candidatus Aquilonibacter sp.]
MATQEVSIPVPPRDAQQFQTGCKYCIVACGYRVYKWPVGRNGGAAPSQNAFGIDLSQPNTAQWISPSMFNVIEENGRKYNVAIIPDNNCVVNSGLNSVRGGTMGLTVYRKEGPTSARLQHPLVWAHGQQEASWDDAVEIVARVTHQLLAKDGPDSIGVKFSDHGGQGGGYEFTWSTGKFFYQSVKTTMATVHNRPTVFGEPMASRDMGIPELNIAYEDGEIADTIVIFGADPYSDQTNYYLNHMVPNLQGLTTAKKKHNYPGKPLPSSRMIVVDPRRTVTVTTARAAGGADNVLHLQVDPGKDVVLMNAIARVILEHGWENDEFIRDHVEADSVAPYKAAVGADRPLAEVLSEASREAGVPASQIVQAAEWIAKPLAGGHRPATLFHYEKGAIWSIKNYPVVASYVDLAVLTGNLGKPGTGCSRLGGHQEGYARPDYPGKRPGVYVEKLLAQGQGPKLWWFIGCNPIQTAPDSSSIAKFMSDRGAPVKEAMNAGGSVNDRVQRILDAVDKGGLFIVGQDIYPTQAIEAAHVVFPAATQFELNMTSINGERRMRLYQKFMDPPGEAKPDWEIMALVAKRIEALFGADGNKELADRFSGYDWKTDADVFADAAQAAAAGRQGEAVSTLPENSKTTFDPEDVAFLDHQFILSKGINGIQVPVNTKNGKRVGTVRLFEDGKFNRPSGRAAFIPAKQPALPAEVAAQKAKYRYLINNGRFDAMWQTGYETWRKPVIADRWGRNANSFLQIHPEDAHALHLASGDIARIHNDYATVTAVAYVTDQVKPGAPFLMFAQPKGTADFLVTPAIDAQTNIPYYKGTYADIERVTGPSEALRKVTFKPMDIVTT